MKRMNRWTRAARGLLVGLLLVPAAAHADGGLFVTPDVLAAPARASLTAQIAAARRLHPEAFAQVAEVQGAARQADRVKRGRLAPMSLYFKALGPDALMPMLERLAFTAPPREVDLPDSAWDALGVGMLDAVGALRDPRARPVLESVLAHAQSDATRRAAAGALGRVCDAGAAEQLIAAAAGPSGLPVLEALGHCRRPEVGAALARELANHDRHRTWLVARALADLGNVRGDADDALRASAAATLVRIFVTFDGDLRQTAATSLLVVAWPGTEQLVTRARATSPELTRDLDRLISRLRANPVH